MFAIRVLTLAVDDNPPLERGLSSTWSRVIQVLAVDDNPPPERGLSSALSRGM